MNLQKVGSDITLLTSDKIEYCHTYSCGCLEPTIEIFYVFKNRKLVGIWTEFKLDEIENIPLMYGFFNLNKSVTLLKTKLIEDINYWLNFSPLLGFLTYVSKRPDHLFG